MYFYILGTTSFGVFLLPCVPNGIAALFSVPSRLFGSYNSGSIPHVYLTKSKLELIKSSILPEQTRTSGLLELVTALYSCQGWGASLEIFLGLLLSKGFSESR